MRRVNKCWLALLLANKSSDLAWNEILSWLTLLEANVNGSEIINNIQMCSDLNKSSFLWVIYIFFMSHVHLDMIVLQYHVVKQYVKDTYSWEKIKLRPSFLSLLKFHSIFFPCKILCHPLFSPEYQNLLPIWSRWSCKVDDRVIVSRRNFNATASYTELNCQIRKSLTFTMALPSSFRRFSDRSKRDITRMRDFYVDKRWTEKSRWRNKNNIVKTVDGWIEWWFF